MMKNSVGNLTTRLAIARKGTALSGAVGLCLLSAVAAAQIPAPSGPEPPPADPAAPGGVAPAPIDAAPAPEAAPGNATAASPESAGALDANLEPGPPPGAGGLDEVVVTVDRRAKNLQK